MAQNITLMGASYSAVPSVTLPKTGGGTATFTDTSDATLNNGNKMLSGNTAYSNGTKYTGSIPSKSAQTYTPTTADQTIASGQYLTGTQTILGDANLLAENIKDGVTIFGVTGTYTGGSATKTVSISLTNPLNPDSFSDGTIFEMLSSDPWDINNPVLDRLNSPTSSGTYTISSTSYGINVVLGGASIYTESATCVCTGGADLTSNYGYGFVFVVSADGTINIDGVNYDD